MEAAEEGSELTACVVLLFESTSTLNNIKQQVVERLQASPNCAEVLSKYRQKDAKDTIVLVKVRWASEGRDEFLFPKETVLTAENCRAILRLISLNRGRDVLDVTVETSSGAEK